MGQESRQRQHEWEAPMLWESWFPASACLAPTPQLLGDPALCCVPALQTLSSLKDHVFLLWCYLHTFSAPGT